jgi:hypothetical protein
MAGFSFMATRHYREGWDKYGVMLGNEPRLCDVAIAIELGYRFQQEVRPPHPMKVITWLMSEIDTCNLTR